MPKTLEMWNVSFKATTFESLFMSGEEGGEQTVSAQMKGKWMEQVNSWEVWRSSAQTRSHPQLYLLLCRRWTLQQLPSRPVKPSRCVFRSYLRGVRAAQHNIMSMLTSWTVWVEQIVYQDSTPVAWKEGGEAWCENSSSPSGSYLLKKVNCHILICFKFGYDVAAQGSLCTLQITS